VRSEEVLVCTLLREQGDTGVQTHVRALREHLATEGGVARLVTPFSSGSALMAPTFAMRRIVQPVSGSAGVWWYREGHRYFLERALRTAMSESKSRVAVYAQCPVSAAAALRVRTDERVVLAVHFNVSQAHEWADKGLIPRDGRLAASIERFEAEVLPRVDGLVFVSEYMRDVVHERIPATRSTPWDLVPNFVDVPDATGPRLPARDLVTVGTLEPRKNHEYLLRVLATASAMGRDFTLTVIGAGPERGRLEALARGLGVRELVDFRGFVPDPVPLLREHRLYVHASRMESFGIAVAEAMAQGIPALVGPVGALPEVVRDGVEGSYWPLDDPTEGARRLLDMLSDESRLEAMGRRARERARRHYAREVQAPRLVDFVCGAASAENPR